MNKQEFINALRERICDLPRIDVDEQLQFFKEMIDERMADGLSEEEAVADIGSIEVIREQIVENIPLLAILGNKLKQKRSTSSTKIAVISSTAIIWAPVLLALIVAAVAVVASLYTVLWALVVSVWAVFIALAAAAPFGVVMGLLNLFGGNALFGICIIGCGITSAGLAIFAFYGALYASKGGVILTRKIWFLIKKLFVR